MAAKTRPIFNNFSSGEISPKLDGRIDLTQYFNGLQTLRNWLCVPQGGAKTRGGFHFVAEVDYTNGMLNEVRLVPIVLEFDPEKPLSEQRTTAGVPRLANGKQSKKIIENLAHLSRLYGTDVKYRDGLGFINP